MENAWFLVLKKKVYEKVALNPAFLVLLLVLYPILSMWQGLDFTDTGFALTNAQQIFSDPSSIHYGFQFWLPNVISGIWLYFFGEVFGVIGFKFASVLIVYATIFFAFLIFKPYFKREQILLGLFLAELFIVRWYWVEYNNLTALLYVIAVFLLLEGLTKHNNQVILLSGFFLGLNIFNRISNVLGLSFLLGIFAFGYWNAIPLKELIKNSLSLVSGFIIAILVISGIMVYSGQFTLYINSILILGSAASSGTSMATHSIGNLFILFSWEHFLAFSLMFSLIIIFIISSKMYSFLNRRSSVLSTGFLTGLFLIGVLASIVSSRETYYFFELNLPTYVIILAYGCLSVILLKNIFLQSPENKQLPLLSLISLLVLIISPLGSSNGMYNAMFGMWLAIPLCFICLLEFTGFSLEIDIHTNNAIPQKFRIDEGKTETKTVLCLFLLIILSFLLIHAYQFTYYDSKDRFEMVHTVNGSHLDYVLTTDERARVVQELVDELPHYIKKGDYVLAYEDIPLVYYLTGSRPYVDSWPEETNPHQYRDELNKTMEAKRALPIIVRTEFSTVNNNWPENSKLIQFEPRQAFRETMDGFIAAHHYNVAWSNGFFEILTTGDSNI